MLTVGKEERIFFNGDSITDAGRDRADVHSLAGYTAMAAEGLCAKHPDASIECFNRGISGNRTADVLARIRGELKEIKPTLFCLLIGINDVWRKYDCGDPTAHAAFEANVSGILTEAKAYTGRILILEPFLIAAGPDRTVYYEDLMPKILILRRLATAFGAQYLPLDGMFAAAAVKDGGETYSYDGVHLTEAGNRLVADAIVTLLA